MGAVRGLHHSVTLRLPRIESRITVGIGDLTKLRPVNQRSAVVLPHGPAATRMMHGATSAMIGQGGAREGYDEFVKVRADRPGDDPGKSFEVIGGRPITTNGNGTRYGHLVNVYLPDESGESNTVLSGHRQAVMSAINGAEEAGAVTVVLPPFAHGLDGVSAGQSVAAMILAAAISIEKTPDTPIRDVVINIYGLPEMPMTEYGPLVDAARAMMKMQGEVVDANGREIEDVEVWIERMVAGLNRRATFFALPRMLSEIPSRLFYWFVNDILGIE